MDKRVKGISVVLASYNSKPQWLVDSVVSCLSAKQTWDGEIEVVLVDDGSTDDLTKYTQDKLSQFKGVNLIRLEENVGLPAALNQGIINSTHDWIARQDDDDISLPERFQTQVDFIEKTPDCKIVGSQIYFYQNGKRSKITGHQHLVTSDILNTNSRHWFFNHGTLLAEKSLLCKVGMYDSNLNESWQPEDWDLWRRLLESGVNIYNLPEKLYEYRVHDDNKSQIGMQKKLNWMDSQIKPIKEYGTQ